MNSLLPDTAPRPIVSFLVSLRGWVTWKQLFEQEVPVSVEVRTHSQRQSGSQVGQAIDIPCLNTPLSGCMCSLVLQATVANVADRQTETVWL